MKTILMSMALLLMSSAIFAQVSTVTINLTGNRNRQVLVDNQPYTVDNVSASDVKSVVINDVTPGQHTLELVRSNTNRYGQNSKTNFTVREGFDLTITVTSTGALTTSETRAERQGGNRGDRGNRAMNANQFTRVYNATKAKPSSASRASYLENEFNTSNRHMSSQQASQLIQLVNSESSRLKLAKLSYENISDPQNFSVVVNLLNSSINRRELNNYIATVVRDNDNDNTGGNASGPIDDARYRVIYSEIQAEPTATERAYYLNNFFGRDFNYYTSAQAKQFIELVQGEQERFNLAKAAYRGVTDRQNYSVVYPLLGNSYNRSALQTYINGYTDNNNNNPNTGTRVAMSANDFERLYSNVNNSYNTSTRYTTINTAFTTNGNYFTVAQAKRLIPLVNDENNRLQLAKASYKVLVDPTNYLQYNDFLNSTASRNDFRNYVMSYNGGSVGMNNAMSDADYDRIYRSVNGSWGSASKIQLLNDAFGSRNNYFTTAQVRQLLTLITSENDRLPLARSAYDNTVDQANYTQLYDLFTFPQNRNDLARFVANGSNDSYPGMRVAMQDAEFRNIYNRVSSTFGLGAKFSELSNIFNTETNYFTVAQARQLIALVSAETNRIELAKASYNNIVDQENFQQMYDLIGSQQGKNELSVYVRNNGVAN